MTEPTGYVPWPVVVAVKAPRITLLLFIAFGFLCSIFMLQFFDLSDPLAGIRLRDDITAERADGWIRALEEVNAFWAERAGDSSSVKEVQQTRCYGHTILLHVTKDNALTPQGIAQMQRVESEIKSLPGFSDFCRKDADSGECNSFNSILLYLDMDNVTTQEQIDAQLINLWETSRGAMRNYLQIGFYEENEEGQLYLKSPMTRADFCFGLPLAGYRNGGDRRKEQLDIIHRWISRVGSFEEYSETLLDSPNGVLTVTWQFDYLLNKKSSDMLAADTMKVLIAIVFVLCVITLHLRSAFLGALGLLQVLLSFPIGFNVYRILLGIELFGGLSSAGLILIVGIGIDDVAIFSDAFKQTLPLAVKKDWTLERRLSFAFKRARFTMLVTTVTTAFAFLLLAFSRIPAVRYFGIFCSILIFCNFLLVISMYTCVLSIWDTWVRRIRLTCHGNGDAKNESLVIESGLIGDDETEELGDVDSEETIKNMRKTKGLESAPLFSRMLLMAGSFFEWEDEQDIANAKVVEIPEEIEELRVLNEPKQLSEPDEPPIRIAVLVATRKNALRIVGFFLIIGIIFTGFTTNLKTASQDNPFWREGHPFKIFQDSIPKTFLYFEDEGAINFHVPFGLERPFINRSGTKETLSFDLGKPVYDDAFDISHEEVQQGILDICQDIYEERSSLDIINGGAFCAIAALSLWREARNEPFPVPRPEPIAPKIDISAPIESLSADPIVDVLLDFVDRSQFGPFRNQIGMKKGDDSRPGVNFVMNTFETRTFYDDAFRERVKVDEAWNKEFKKLEEDSSDALGDFYYTEFEYFIIMQSQALFLSSSFTSLGLTIVLTCIFLIAATNNWILAVIAVATFFGIIVSVLGGVTILGIQIETISAICISLFLAFSVDFAVHMLIAYDEAFKEKKLESRLERVDHMYRTVSISVLAGGLSTLGASLVLLFGELRLFLVFGTFLVVALVSALIWSLLFLPAMLALFGPVGAQGALFRFLAERRKSDGLGIYAVENHETRSARGKRIASHGCMPLLFIFLFLTAFLAFARESQILLWSSPAEEQVDVPDPFANASMKVISDLEPGAWNMLRPGGNATCARGQPYTFFFKPSSLPSAATLIIEYGDGAPCWNFETCRAEARAFTDSTDYVTGILRDVVLGQSSLQGLSDPEGPWKDAHHLFLPMCTGDLGWGNQRTSYADDVVVEHRGALNVISALNWLLPQVEQMPVTNILSTGTGSGALTSIVFFSIVAAFLEAAKMGEDIRMFQHGDGGMGLFTPGFLEEATPRWGANIEQGELLIQIANDTLLSVPIFGVVPEEFDDLFDLISNVNLTGANECITALNETNLTLSENTYADVFFGQEELDPAVQACLNISSSNASAGILLPNLLDLFDPDTGFIVPINGGNGNNSHTNSTSGGGSGNGDSGDEGSGFIFLSQEDLDNFNTIDWEEWIDANCINTTQAELLNITAPDADEDGLICGNVTVPEQFQDLDSSDFNVTEDNVIQLIPSLHLVSSLRYPQHEFSQFTTAYDYFAARDLASQYLGEPAPGANFQVQELFHEYLTTVYDLYLPFMPPNHHFFMSQGDAHGFLRSDRLYRAINAELFQVIYAGLNDFDLESNDLPLDFDCRVADNCLQGVDTRESIVYFQEANTN